MRPRSCTCTTPREAIFRRHEINDRADRENEAFYFPDEMFDPFSSKQLQLAHAKSQKTLHSDEICYCNAVLKYMVCCVNPKGIFTPLLGNLHSSVASGSSLKLVSSSYSCFVYFDVHNVQRTLSYTVFDELCFLRPLVTACECKIRRGDVKRSERIIFNPSFFAATMFGRLFYSATLTL